MRTLTLVAIVAGLLHPWDAFANFPKDTQSWPGYNMIGDLNPGFENGTTQWTATAGGTFTASTSVYAEGLRAAAWTPSASGQFLTSPAAAVGLNINAAGRNGVASCLVRTSASGYTLEAIDGSSNVLVSSSITSSSAGFVRVSGNFIFPNGAGTSVKVRIKSAGTTIAYVDSCYVGPAEGFNISQVGQTQLYGSISFEATSGCVWSTTSASYANFSANATCPNATTTGQATSSGKTPSVTFSSLPPGEYMVFVSGRFTCFTAGTTANLGFTVSDGSTTSGTVPVTCRLGATTNITESSILLGRFSYSVAKSNLTFNVQGKTDAAGNPAYLVAGNAPQENGLTISVVRSPTSSELAVSANIPGAPTIQKFTSGSGTYTRPSGVKYLRVRMVGGGGGGSDGASRSGSDGGNTTFGTLTAARGKGAVGGGPSGSPGVASSGSSIGSFSGVLIEGSAGNAGMANAAGRAHGGGGGTSYFGGAGLGPQCESGTVTGGTAATNSGSGGGGGCSGASANAIEGHGGGAGGYVEVFIPNPSATYSYSVGGSGAGAVNGGSGGAGYIEVTEYYGVMDAPILVGSVTSNSTGAERVERVRVLSKCSSSPCTIDSQSGSWLSSVSRAGAGVYVLNIASGIFSSTPVCTCRAIDPGVGVRICTGPYAGNTATSVAMETWNTSGVASDGAFEAICMGSR